MFEKILFKSTNQHLKMSSKENLPEIIQKNTEGIEHNDITKYTNYNFDKDIQDFDNSQDKTNDRTGGETVILEGNDYNYKDNSSIDEGLISPKQLNQTQNKNGGVSIDDEDQKINESFFKNCNPHNNVEKLNNDNLFKKQEDSLPFLNIKNPCIFPPSPPSPPPDVPNNNCNIEEMTPKKKYFPSKKKIIIKKFPQNPAKVLLVITLKTKKLSNFLLGKQNTVEEKMVKII